MKSFVGGIFTATICKARPLNPSLDCMLNGHVKNCVYVYVANAVLCMFLTLISQISLFLQHKIKTVQCLPMLDVKQPEENKTS